MIKCKNCGCELPPDAKFCDKCGTPVEKEKPKEPARLPVFLKEHKKGIKNTVIILIALTLLTFVISYQQSHKTVSKESALKLQSRVTAEQYQKLKCGMSHEQVEKLLGVGARIESGYDMDAYVWAGEYADYFAYETVNEDFPYIEVVFNTETDSVKDFSENGVIDGKELYENSKNDKIAEVVKDETWNNNVIKDGMTYDEVKEILGKDGTLDSSLSYYDMGQYKTYKWKIVQNDIPDYLWIHFHDNIVENTY